MATARFSGSRIEFVLDRGGSVRLIGDDQQLAAIGAGGVLRDIQATYGAVQLNELVRFADPGEGAASLALRAGDPEALGFYLDNHRVHVGDLGTCADQVFDAWLTARHAGADALMVAPTRMLVAELNARAQADLRGGVRPTRTVALADGSDAAVGDVIITRVNDRRLRTSGTDWVRNGDRWNITGIATNGDLRAIHQTNRQTVILPAAYVTGLLRHRPRLQRWDRGRERVDRTPPPHRQRLPQPRQLSATHAPHRRWTEPGPTAGMKSQSSMVTSTSESVGSMVMRRICVVQTHAAHGRICPGVSVRDVVEVMIEHCREFIWRGQVGSYGRMKCQSIYERKEAC